jgi:hypothetical protein
MIAAAGLLAAQNAAYRLAWRPLTDAESDQNYVTQLWVAAFHGVTGRGDEKRRFDVTKLILSVTWVGWCHAERLSIIGA